MLHLLTHSVPTRRPADLHEHPTVAARPREVAHRLHEDREAEDAVDPRGHAGEVADVDVDEAGEAALDAVLLQVDRRGHAHRQGDDDGEAPAAERAAEALGHTPAGIFPAHRPGEERPGTGPD